MLSLLACSLALQAPIIQPHRLRTILTNGAVVLVERDRTAKRLAIQLFVSAQGTLETASTHGLRHLLEHLEAPGRDHDLDRRLETRGAFLTAETLRDATVYSLSLRPADLEFGLHAVSDVMELGPVSHEDIVREAEIIRQEQALEELPARLSEAAWRTAYGDDGLDPSGDPDVIAAASPEQIAKLHHEEFQGGNLVLVITGDVDLDQATVSASDLLKNIPAGSEAPMAMRRGHGGGSTAAAEGEARAALVTDFNSMQTAARLAAALGMASELEGSFVTYTPSQRGGLILVGTTGRSSGLGSRIDKIDPAVIFSLGRSLARHWVDRQIGPGADGFLRGLLLVQGAGVRPETMLDNLKQMTPDDFRAAVSAFRMPTAVEVAGQ